MCSWDRFPGLIARGSGMAPMMARGVAPEQRACVADQRRKSNMSDGYHGRALVILVAEKGLAAAGAARTTAA